jgi:hypothetical protein
MAINLGNRRLGKSRSICRVEDRRGGLRQWGVAVTGGFLHRPVPQSVPKLRFPSPLIKPCMRFPRTRLSDRLHQKAHGDLHNILVRHEGARCRRMKVPPERETSLLKLWGQMSTLGRQQTGGP